MRSYSLGDVLFTKTQQKVLGLLFGRPGQSFYLNEIVRLSSVGRGTVNRELERMEAAGIITKQKIGNQNHYQANPNCPIYGELIGIVRKTFGIAEVIEAALKSRDEEIEIAFIYGSIARSEDRADSDIDLMVIAPNLAYAELMEALSGAEQELGRTINPSIYDAAEIKRKLGQKNAFLVRVMEQPKIWIKGGEDDLGAFG